jgi:hypothetical protein
MVAILACNETLKPKSFIFIYSLYSLCYVKVGYQLPVALYILL